MRDDASAHTPLDLPLDRSGTVLIEASAGTGKTHALTTLVARLVAEEGREIDEILIVTFTRAATAELRDRIRRALKAARDAVRAPAAQRETEPGPQAETLARRWSGPAGIDPATAARRLDAALADIDRASVYTIHGFCQRVLGDLAFEGAFPFGFEVSGDDKEPAAAAVRDFWRRHFYDASLPLVRYAVETGFLPRTLTEWTRAGRTKPGLRVTGGEAPRRPLHNHEAEWRNRFEAARAGWDAHGEALRTEMLEGDWLNRSRYRTASVGTRLERVEKSFSAPEPRLWPAGDAAWFGTEGVSGACKTGAELPDNPMFDLFDALEAASETLRSAFDEWLRWARAELIGELRARARRRAREERQLRYDDLLIEVEAALGSRHGDRLAENIRRAYPVALIDEYQDTDQTQARIFSRVYSETPRGSGDEGRGCALFVVGDPKQSIYRFRGADIFAYLGTRRRARRVLTLDANWRSTPGLVAAVNELFAVPAPFALPEIEYRAVTAASAGDAEEHVPGEAGERPFSFRLFPRHLLDEPWNKDDASRMAVAASADEIAVLLGASAQSTGEAMEGETTPRAGGRLRGSDIAVLVRTRHQGQRIAAALRARGVRAAEVSDESVFDTREAEHLERLLRCLAEPVPERQLRGALAGDLFALDSAALLAMEEDDEVWSDWRERLRTWRGEWETSGVGALLLRLLEVEGGAERLLRHRDGARRLTNYRHLAELLLDAETGSRLSPAGLARWLGRRRQAGERGRDESVLLRLDSDEELVRILTVHGSKGLEFPVVFCPFVWHVPDPRRAASDPDVSYHEHAGDEYREVLALEPDAAARDAAQWEEFSESLRLLYVALTRAKYRCVVTWGQVKGAGYSPLAWLLHREPEAAARSAASAPDTGRAGAQGGTGTVSVAARSGSPRERGARLHDTRKAMRGAVRSGEPAGEDSVPVAAPEGAGALDAVGERFLSLSWAEWREEVEALARRCPEGISVSGLGPDRAHPGRPAEPPPPVLRARRPLRPLRRTRQMTSYSALSADGARAAGEALHALSERPEHDARETLPPRRDEEGEGPPESDGARSAFTFPRGATAGSCLHRIFERLDREAPGGTPLDLDLLCRNALLDFGFEEHWRPVVRTMVERARAVRLHAPGEPEGGDAAAASPPSGSAAPHRARGAVHSGADPALAERRGAGPGADRDRTRGPGKARDGDGARGFRLADPIQRIAEMEFNFPVAGLTPARLAQCLAEYGYPNPFGEGADGGDACAPAPIDGFLRGFIDLTVEHEGRWYLLDYKSNWLGPEAADYAPAALVRATHASGYPLQYLIYLVALHRHLAIRLPGYDYERHVGGVFYLYLRGMDPAAGMSRGVYFDRPRRACIEALDDCFQGGGEHDG